MKTKTLFFLATLLAIGGSLFGQGTPVKNLFGSGVPNANLASVVGTTYVDQSTNPATAYTCTAVTLTPTASQCTWTASAASSGISFVSSLPATCTPGVTANVALSVSPFNEYYCFATNIWQPVASAFNTPGVFNTTTTISTMSTPNVFAVGSGVDQFCPTRVYNNFAALGSVGLTDTDALDGCIVIPAGTGVTNAASTGVQGWAWNNNNSASGQFGFTAAAGLGGFSTCNAGGGTIPYCLGASIGAQSILSNGGAKLGGVEADITAPNNADTGLGFLASLRGAGTATLNNMKGFWLQKINTNKWTVGFFCDTASVSLTSTYAGGCFVAGDSGDGVHDSLFQHFVGGNTNTTQCPVATCVVAINQTADDFLTYGARVFQVGRFASPGIIGNDAAFAITGKVVTASLAAGVLVKIDTSNADAWVICTTVDTACDGVSAGSTYCVTTATSCAIVTVPGSRVELLLGTGACTIGQFVIVDTTTNGRIKCQAGIPAAGAYIGKAISAQAVVGNAVDVLTKFQ